MLICGLTILATVMLTVKLMQSERVSVVMGVMSGLMMIGTSNFGSAIDWIGAVIIIFGVVLLLKKEYNDVQY